MPSNSFVYVTPVRHKHYGHLGCLDRWADEFGQAIQEVAAKGGHAMDVFQRLAARPEGAGHRVVPMDPSEPEPEIYRCCSCSEEELRCIRTVSANIVRKGYVQALGAHQLTLDYGTEPSFGPRTVFARRARALEPRS